MSKIWVSRELVRNDAVRRKLIIMLLTDVKKECGCRCVDKDVSLVSFDPVKGVCCTIASVLNSKWY